MIPVTIKQVVLWADRRAESFPSWPTIEKSGDTAAYKLGMMQSVLHSVLTDERYRDNVIAEVAAVKEVKSAD